jgi:acyl dehydratase
MALPTKHVIHQGRVVASLANTAFAALMQRVRKAPAGPVPGPEIAERIAAPNRDLVRDYVRHVGGDPGAYRSTVPAHMFPHWGFPLAARTLKGIPYPMMRVLNGGCRLEIHRPLPADQPLSVKARLESIDDDGKRAVLHQRVDTGDGAVVGHLYAIVPVGEGKKAAGARKDPARVPQGARELAYWRLGPEAGLAFAMLTGDFNPVHWVRPYAKAMGFRSTILHGFATMARAIEGLNRSVFAGDVSRLKTFDCKFTRPLVLPARVGLYVQGTSVFVGDAPGGPAYLVGEYTV